ncbi:hypothetical protein FISHEDRAFT_62883 [Fistulina hepatica ATCC 64428]|uniref:CBM1 domain-containing protein n=1 Tax=Fistulina hepatica ATCC 64428 TaxID=1128425 RepID=A0A0D7A087_9AGAR|nr:hypothetical protein FISHEDRAFT_62883 [Fistulina hepatica ATCC 64428]
MFSKSQLFSIAIVVGCFLAPATIVDARSCRGQQIIEGGKVVEVCPEGWYCGETGSGHIDCIKGTAPESKTYRDGSSKPIDIPKRKGTEPVERHKNEISSGSQHRRRRRSLYE